jgi:hypothetical protein
VRNRNIRWCLTAPNKRTEEKEVDDYQKLEILTSNHTAKDLTEAKQRVERMISIEEKLLSNKSLGESAIKSEIARNPSERNFYVDTLKKSVSSMNSALNVLKGNLNAEKSMISRAQSCKSKAERLLNVARNC